MIIFWIIISFLFITTVIVMFNYFSAPVFKKFLQNAEKDDFISILIPARNEENNIGNCLRKVLLQDYNNFEIVVLDDQSDDRTLEILTSFEKETNKIKVVRGKQLPDDFTGKNWACHQLSEKAEGDYLLFIDADVILETDAVSRSLAEMKKYKLQMLSVFPTQIIKSFGETLIVPLMNWLLLTFLPLKFVYTFKSKSFSAANGQFIIFENNAYRKSGGHSSLRTEIVEDMEFARKLKTMDYKVKTYLGGSLVSCRMYSDFKSAFTGFSKNFFPGFKISAVSFIIILILFQICYLLPIIMIFFNYLFAATFIMILLQRILISIISGQYILVNTFLHPVQMMMALFVGLNSIRVTFSKNRIWKGRRL